MMVSIQLTHRLCPVCGIDAERLSVQSHPTGETQTFERLQTCWNQSVKDRIFLSYARCKRCGILYCPDFFSADQLTALYSQMPDNTAGVPTAVFAKTQRGYFDVFKQFSSLQGQFLEVGPDLGFFLERAVNEGAFEEFWLFEPKEQVQGELNRILNGKKSHLYKTLLNTDVLPDNKITGVVMVHVLDHFLDPKGILTGLRPKLAPGAVACFVTHDEKSLLARALGQGWGGYSLEHPHVFNKHSLTNLLKESGYKVLASQGSANYFPLSFLIQQALAAIGIKTGQWKFLSGITLRVKLGNLITIASPV